MNSNSKADLLHELRDPETRRLHVQSQVRVGIPLQIRAMRESRGWTQEQLAEKIGTTQNAVSRLESPQYGRPNIQTLLRIAEALDVALLVRFAPFSDFIDIVDGMSETSVVVPGFNDDQKLGRKHTRKVRSPRQTTRSVRTARAGKR